jgi:hypothetical protein
MKKLIIFSFIYLASLAVVGQRGYIIKDSTVTFGVNINDSWRFLKSGTCSGIYRSRSFTYSPYDIEEYGFISGKVYISRKITIGDSTIKVFLEREVNGNTKLYNYRNKKINTYFIDKGDNYLIELPKKNKDGTGYQNKLLTLTSDCKEVSELCKFASFTNRSLSVLINQYNKCESSYFPHSKIGLIVSYGLVHLFPSPTGEYEYLGKNDLASINSSSIGIFIDNPILASVFSVRAELSYDHCYYSLSKQLENLSYNLHGKMNTFTIPLLIMARLPFKKVQPYINGGIIQSILTRKDYSVYETNIYETFIEINKIDFDNYSKRLQYGYEMGIGVDYQLWSKDYISFEIRYKKLTIPSGSGLFGESGLNILTGISF